MSLPSKRKRQQPTPRKPPQFLDATVAITASRFAGARLPELTDLWRNVRIRRIGGSFAPPPTNEICPLNHNKKHPSSVEKSSNSYSNIFDVSRHLGKPFESKGGAKSVRHLRRRTGSHVPKRRHRAPFQRNKGVEKKKDNKEEESLDEQGTGKVCRRARRKPNLLMEVHRVWQNRSDGNVNVDSSSDREDVEGDNAPINWIETHLWHRKRFVMTNLFGWCVPIQHSNRGARAAIRLSKTSCTLQDATWECRPIEICCRKFSNDDTVQQQQYLTHLLAEACGGKMNESFYKNVHLVSVWKGYYMIDGVLHNHKEFPAGAISPAKFLFGKLQTDSNHWRLAVHVYVHPSVYKEVKTFFEYLIKEEDLGDDIEKPRSVKNGTSYFRVRGYNATNLLVKSFDVFGTNENEVHNWERFFQSNSCIKNGAVVPVKLRRRSIAATSDHDGGMSEISCGEVTDDNRKNRNNLYDDCDFNNIDSRSLQTFIHDDNSSCILIHRKDRNKKDVGWDMICPSIDAKAIFTSLTLSGANVIGIVEAEALRVDNGYAIEPMFPYDFPDTAQGRLYWNGKAGSDWCLIRQAIGGSRKRDRCSYRIKQLQNKISSKFQVHEAIDWLAINPPSNQSSILVIRQSDFGSVFVKMLSSSASITQKKVSNGKSRCRCAQKSRVQTPNLLCKEERLKHTETCRQLCRSLTAPTLVFCSITMIKEGMLVPGLKIYAFDTIFDEEHNNIGVVTAGRFSSQQGRCVGSALMSADRFLTSLAKGFIVSVAYEQSQKRIELKVWVKGKGNIQKLASIYPIFS